MPDYEVNNLSLELIDPPETKIRDLDFEALIDLKNSIKQFGVLQPVLVRPIENTGHYQIIFGYHRYLAAKGVGLKEIPAQIKNVDRATALLMAITENIHRVEMNPLKEGELYNQLLGYYDIKNLCRLLGKSEGYIKGRLDMFLNLHPSLRTELGKRLTIGLAIRLAKARPNTQLRIFEEVEKARDDLSNQYIPKEHRPDGCGFGKPKKNILVCVCARCGALHKKGEDTASFDEPFTE